MAKDTLANFFKEVDSINKDGAWLSSARFAYPTEWYSTGCKAFNAIISGSLYKGVPGGRLIGFQGESQTGKTLMMYQIMADAQKKGCIPVIWDTEGGIDRDGALRVGLDPDRVKYYPVDTVEDCRNQITRLLDKVNSTNNPPKLIIGIDSLGNLSSSKELADADKNKDATDMGLRAKALKSMMRTITYKAAKAGVTIIFTNHIYDDPSAMFPSLVKNSSGGKGATYMASVLVQLTVSREKFETKKKPKKGKKSVLEEIQDEEDSFDLDEAIGIKKEEQPEENPDRVGIAHSVNGINISALTIKNRFVPPFLKAEIYLNFKTGLDDREGLIDMAKGMGIIKVEGHSYILNGENLGTKKSFNDDPKAWEKIEAALEAKLQEEVHFSQTGKTSVLQNISDENKELVSEEDLELLNEEEEFSEE